jgi:two-component system CheB/CheR fusion protein
MEISANRIYVLPYVHEVHFKDNKITLAQATSDTSPPRPSVDQVFTSLADTYKQHAIGIIFSGAEIDGVQGCKAIKAAGGITIAQPPYSAKFDSMPKAAIQLAGVDLLLTPEQVANRLAEFDKNPKALNLDEESDLAPESSQQIIKQILKLTGINFLNYKLATINRQIKRRMALLHIDTIKDYGLYIKDNQNESSLLANNFLVCVTSFFRDNNSYQSLKLALKDIVKRKHPSDEIRIWVPGCATGEEAYSIAILLAEILGDELPHYRIQIFGTDINPHTIQFACTVKG